MRIVLAVLLLAALAACDALPPDGGRGLRVANQTDRPVAVFAVPADQLARIDPQPALRGEVFDARMVVAGRTARLEPVPDLGAGDGVGIFVYARTDPLPAHLAQQYGAGAAPLVKVQNVSAAELRARGYTVIVRDLGR